MPYYYIDVYTLILHANQTFTILFDLKPFHRGPYRKEILNYKDQETQEHSIYKDEYGAFAFEIWQLKSGTLFDSLLVTDDLNEAK